MVDAVNVSVRANEVPQTGQNTSKYLTYRAKSDYEKSPVTDTFESQNNKGKGGKTALAALFAAGVGTLVYFVTKGKCKRAAEAAVNDAKKEGVAALEKAVNDAKKEGAAALEKAVNDAVKKAKKDAGQRAANVVAQARKDAEARVADAERKGVDALQNLDNQHKAVLDKLQKEKALAVQQAREAGRKEMLTGDAESLVATRNTANEKLEQLARDGGKEARNSVEQEGQAKLTEMEANRVQLDNKIVEQRQIHKGAKANLDYIKQQINELNKVAKTSGRDARQATKQLKKLQKKERRLERQIQKEAQQAEETTYMQLSEQFGLEKTPKNSRRRLFSW